MISRDLKDVIVGNLVAQKNIVTVIKWVFHVQISVDVIIVQITNNHNHKLEIK